MDWWASKQRGAKQQGKGMENGGEWGRVQNGREWVRKDPRAERWLFSQPPASVAWQPVVRIRDEE